MAAIQDRDLGWNKIKASILGADRWVTAVGYPGSAGIDNAIVTRAAVHEYGSVSRKVPSRPFMRQAVDIYKRPLEQRMELEGKNIIDAKVSPRTAVARLGEFFTGAIKATFTRGSFRPLKAKTIARKGSSRPLIDTGEMRNSVTHKEFKR